MILTRGTSYEALVRAFRWSIPQRFNIAVACVDRRAEAEPDRPALIRYEDGRQNVVTYGKLRDDSDRLAHALRARGIGRGDRVAVFLPQSAETVIAHLAAYKLGAIVVPLAALFGPDALRFRLAASGVKAVVTDSAGAGQARRDSRRRALARDDHLGRRAGRERRRLAGGAGAAHGPVRRRSRPDPTTRR